MPPARARANFLALPLLLGCLLLFRTAAAAYEAETACGAIAAGAACGRAEGEGACREPCTWKDGECSPGLKDEFPAVVPVQLVMALALGCGFASLEGEEACASMSACTWSGGECSVDERVLGVMDKPLQTYFGASFLCSTSGVESEEACNAVRQHKDAPGYRLPDKVCSWTNGTCDVSEESKNFMLNKCKGKHTEPLTCADVCDCASCYGKSKDACDLPQCIGSESSADGKFTCESLRAGLQGLAVLAVPSMVELNTCSSAAEEGSCGTNETSLCAWNSYAKECQANNSAIRQAVDDPLFSKYYELNEKLCGKGTNKDTCPSDTCEYDNSELPACALKGGTFCATLKKEMGCSCTSTKTSTTTIVIAAVGAIAGVAAIAAAGVFVMHKLKLRRQQSQEHHSTYNVNPLVADATGP